MYFVLYQDRAKEWRWTLYAANHQKIADSAEGYSEKRHAEHGINLTKSTNAYTPVIER